MAIIPHGNHLMIVNEALRGLTGELGTAFILLLSSILKQKLVLISKDDYPRDIGPVLSKQVCTRCFDFIIVGSGAAGAILANRLTEDGKWNVLLIEAGDYPSPSSAVPAFYPSLINTNDDWHFETARQSNACFGMYDSRCKISRGKVVGGTSTINNLHYMRAVPRDFMDWPKNPQYGWSIKDIYKKYDHLENCTRNCDKNFVYASDGDITLGPLNGVNDYKQLILLGAKYMGYEEMTPGMQTGYMDVLGTIKDGSRENFAKALLKRCRNRPNLIFAANAYVTKILTQLPIDRRTTGVTLVRIEDFQEYTVYAKKEIILTGGAIKTAHLLLLSGFGPKQQLTKLGIPVIADLNVGQRFSDQISTFLFVGIGEGHQRRSSISGIDTKTGDLIDDTYEYIMHRKGRLTNTDVNDVVGFINTKLDGNIFPNLIIYHKLFRKDDLLLPGYLRGLGFTHHIVNSIVKHNKNQTLLLFSPTLIKPKSNGFVQLASANPYVQPIIQPNYLDDPEDFYTLKSGAEYVLQMIGSPEFKLWGAHLIAIDMPSCRNYKFCTSPYISCAVKTLSVPHSQPIGTAPFGNSTSECGTCGNVVDDELLVHGIRHLRIVDGSVLRSHISGNMEPTIAVMADIVAGRIKQYWSQFSKTESLRCP